MKKTSLRHPIPVKFVASFYFSRVSVSTGEKDKTNEKKKTCFLRGSGLFGFKSRTVFV